MDDCLLLAENIVADDVYDFLVFGLVFRSNVLQANAVQGAAVLVVIRVRLVALWHIVLEDIDVVETFVDHAESCNSSELGPV